MNTQHIPAVSVSIKADPECTGLVLIVELEGKPPLSFSMHTGHGESLINDFENARRAISVKASQRKPRGHRSSA